MSVFGKVYGLIDRTADGVATVAHSAVRDELLAALCLLPLAETNLRAPVSHVVTCSDATPTAGGAVECCVSEELADALYTFGEHNGKYARLDVGDSPLSPLAQWSHAELPPQGQ